MKLNDFIEESNFATQESLNFIQSKREAIQTMTDSELRAYLFALAFLFEVKIDSSVFHDSDRKQLLFLLEYGILKPLEKKLKKGQENG